MSPFFLLCEVEGLTTTFWAYACLSRSVFSVIDQSSFPSSILQRMRACAPFAEAHPKSRASSMISETYSNIACRTFVYFSSVIMVHIPEIHWTIERLSYVVLFLAVPPST